MINLSQTISSVTSLSGVFASVLKIESAPRRLSLAKSER